MEIDSRQQEVERLREGLQKALKAHAEKLAQAQARLTHAEKEIDSRQPEVERLREEMQKASEAHAEEMAQVQARLT